jgi:hypothetical protein
MVLDGTAVPAEIRLRCRAYRTVTAISRPRSADQRRNTVPDLSTCPETLAPLAHVSEAAPANTMRPVE